MKPMEKSVSHATTGRPAANDNAHQAKRTNARQAVWLLFAASDHEQSDAALTAIEAKRKAQAEPPKPRAIGWVELAGL